MPDGPGDMGGCQNYGPFLDPYYNTAPIYLGYPKKDHNFDNHPYGSLTKSCSPNGIGFGGFCLGAILAKQFPRFFLVDLQIS